MHLTLKFDVQQTVHRDMFTAIGICHTGYIDCLLAGSGVPLASSQQNLYDLYHCCVYSDKTPDDG